MPTNTYAKYSSRYASSKPHKESKGGPTSVWVRANRTNSFACKQAKPGNLWTFARLARLENRGHGKLVGSFSCAQSGAESSPKGRNCGLPSSRTAKAWKWTNKDRGFLFDPNFGVHRRFKVLRINEVDLSEGFSWMGWNCLACLFTSDDHNRIASSNLISKCRNQPIYVQESLQYSSMQTICHHYFPFPCKNK